MHYHAWPFVGGREGVFWYAYLKWGLSQRELGYLGYLPQREPPGQRPHNPASLKSFSLPHTVQDWANHRKTRGVCVWGGDGGGVCGGGEGWWWWRLQLYGWHFRLGGLCPTSPATPHPYHSLAGYLGVGWWWVGCWLYLADIYTFMFLWQLDKERVYHFPCKLAVLQVINPWTSVLLLLTASVGHWNCCRTERSDIVPISLLWCCTSTTSLVFSVRNKSLCGTSLAGVCLHWSFLSCCCD